MRLQTVFPFSKIAFLDDLQERVPGGTSRNTLLKKLLDPTLALLLIVSYYYIYINANLNYLINFVKDNLYSKIFLEGGGVKSM